MVAMSNAFDLYPTSAEHGPCRRVGSNRERLRESAAQCSPAMPQPRYTQSALQELAQQAAGQETRRVVATYGALEGLLIACRRASASWSGVSPVESMLLRSQIKLAG